MQEPNRPLPPLRAREVNRAGLSVKAPSQTGPMLVIAAIALLMMVGVGLAGVIVYQVSRMIAATVPDQPGYVAGAVDVRQSTRQFNSGGALITIDHFEPPQPGKYPVVLVLHGFDGLRQEGWKRYYHGQCQELARNGRVALLVHYFDATGTSSTDPRAAGRHFAAWAQTLLATLSYAAQLPACDGRKIGIVGTSLGGVLGVSLAAFDARIGAVVQISGVLPDEVAAKLDKLPPLLILHGQRDPHIGLDKIRKEEKTLADRKLSFETHIYPDQGHVFKGAAAADALERTVQFLKKRLN